MIKQHWMLFLLLPLLFISCWGSLAFSRTMAETTTAMKQTQRVTDLYRQGKYNKAIILAKKLYGESKKTFGAKDQRTLDNAANLASLHLALGNYNQAEKLFLYIYKTTQEKYGPENIRTGINCNHLGGLYQALGHYKKALKFFIKASDIYEKRLAPNHIEKATVFNNLAAIYAGIGSYAKANTLYNQALQITEKNLGKNNPKIARILTNLATAQYYLDEFTKTENSLTRALRIEKTNYGAEHPAVADTIYNLGSLYSTIGNYKKSELYLQQALALREKIFGKEHAAVAQNLVALATLHQRSGKFGLAAQEYERALKIQENRLGPAHIEIASTLNGLASIYEAQGVYGKARALYERALTLSTKQPKANNRVRAAILNNIAALYYDLGDTDKTREYLDRALKIKKTINGCDSLAMATAYDNIGSFLYLHAKDYAEAEKLLKKSITIREKKLGGHHFKTLSSWKNLGFLYLESGRADEALHIFTTRKNFRGLGKYYLLRRKFRMAQQMYQKASRNPIKSPQFEIADQIGLGLAEEGLKHFEAAEDHFEQAISIIEEQWYGLSPNERRTFLDGHVGSGFKRLDAYDGMIRVLYRGKRKNFAGRAFKYAEKVKSRNLLQLLATKSFARDKKTDTKFIADFRIIQQQLRAAGRSLQKIRLQGNKVPVKLRENVEAEYTKALSRYHQFTKTTRLHYPGLIPLVAAVEPVSAAKIQAMLAPDTTLLEFYIADKEIYTWTMDHARIDMQRLEVKPANVVSMVNDLLFLSLSGNKRSSKVIDFPANAIVVTQTNAHRKARQKHLIENSKKCFTALIKPILSSLTTKNLVIIPHGILHKLPFSALYDGQKFLIDTYSISIAPSASVFQRVSHRRPSSTNQLLAFANPSAGEENLNFTEPEVYAIGRLFNKKTIFTKTKATESNARISFTKKPDVIHFACHGIFNNQHPMQSALLLASDEKNDGRLEVGEIFDLDLKNTNLVVLSACETAAAKIQNGDDLIGLSQGFIYAGTDSLLATLWKVDDKSTEKIMKLFYTKWRVDKLSKAEALRQAQLTLKKNMRYNNPFFWAPFILIGNYQ